MSKRTAENSNPVQRAKGKPRGKPFPPGVSGNPGGRPKGAKEIRDALARSADDFVDTIKKAAKKGNVFAAKSGLEFVIGKAPQAVHHSGPDGGPIRYDWSKVSNEKLDALEDILQSAAVGVADPGGDSEGEGEEEP